MQNTAVLPELVTQKKGNAKSSQLASASPELGWICTV
jgi:hypothetical protein